MKKNSRIFVAGHRGLVGSAIWKSLENKGYSYLIGRTHKELDLEDPAAVREFFDREKPEYVFLAAAFVGGIIANSRYRADFIFRNLQIQQNVIGESFRAWRIQAPLPGEHLHLPARSPPAHEGNRPAHLPAGIHQRTLCHCQNSRAENVRKFQPAIRHQLHRRHAYKSVRPQ